MLEQLRSYLKPPAFPGDEDKTFTASLLHVILWSLLVGICLYTLVATVLAFVQPDKIGVAWLYALGLGGLTLVLMAVTQRGYIRAAAFAINLGLWIIMTQAAYSNGGVIAPGYTGYLVVIVCTCLLVGWRWGLAVSVASALLGVVFLSAADRLPAFTYSAGSVWSANVTYFFAVTMLLTLALRTIRRASLQKQREAAKRLMTEQALSQSEQRFRSIFDSVNDAIFVQDLADGRILDVNKTMCEMYGYTLEEARQLSVADLSANTPPYTQQEASAWRQKAAQGEPQIFEWRAKDRNGRLFWVEVNMRRAAIDDQDRLLVVVRDIDDRQRTAEREHQIGAGLRAAIEATHELMDCADLDTLYRRSVELAREKIGLERCGLFLLDDQQQDLVGTYGTDATGHTTDERTARHPFQTRPEVFAFSDRLWFAYESALTYWQDDQVQVVEDRGWIVATPIRRRRHTIGVLYNDGAISHAALDEARQEVAAIYCSMLGSLIELKRTEAELAQEHDLLQALMDNFPDTIYFKDTASRFTRVNRAQAQLLGVNDPAEAIGQTDADFFQNSELAQSFLAEEQRLMTSGEPIIDRVEYNPAPDGRPRWLSASKIPLRDASGAIIGMVGISRDITDRRLMEERLRESQARFGSAFEHAAVGMALVAPDHSVVQVNQAFCRMLGYDVAEVVGQRFGSFTHPDDVALSAEYHRRLFAGEIETYQFEKRYLHREGQPIWAWLTVSVVRDAAQRPQYAIAQIQDVTERKQAEERERRISHGLRTVIEAANRLIGYADLDTLYRRAVELARDELQVERCGLFLLDEQGWLCGEYGTDMQRQTTDERGAQFSPVNVANFEAASNQLWTVGEAELTYWDAAERQVVGTGWVATTFIRTRDRVMGVLYNDTAITHAPVDETQQEVLAVYCSLLGSLIELKRAEEALRESEALYRQAIEAAGAVPYYLDYATEAYRYMGEGIRHLTGFTAAEMLPANWDTLLQEVYPLGQAAALRWREAVHETRVGHITVWRADYYVLTQDGRYCWVNDASVQVLDEQGRPRGAIGILQDITDRKRVELALRESESTMRALLDAIPDAIFRFDAQGVFKDYIPAKLLTSPIPAGELIGRRYDEVMPSDVAQLFAENLQAVLQQDEVCIYEYPLPISEQSSFFEARLVRMAQGDVLGIVRDITDRKRAETALQQREAYLRSILDTFPYLVWLKDVNGRFLAVNRVFAQACGQPDSEALVGKTDLDVWPRELAERYREDDRRVMDSNQQVSVEEPIFEIGQETWFETFKSPVVDAQGNVIGTAGFSHDVTARRQAEAAVRESEALFRQLADNAPAFIAMSDKTGLTTYLNRAWQEFNGSAVGLPLEEWTQRIHPDDRRRYTYELQSALQRQRKFTVEYRLRRADGQYRWLLDTVVPRYAADERFAGFIGIAIDISDRKNAEEALRRSEGRLRLITDNMADSISQVDAQHRLVYVSPSAERVYGHALRDLLGRSVYDFMYPEDGSRLYHQIVMAIDLQVPSLRLEYRYRHAAGHHLWVESEIRLLYDAHGDFTGAILGSRDVSTRKQIEAERENLIRELEDKNAELERFTYTVSHDLKSPLITIRGFLGFLEKDATTGNFDRLRADIARIAEATIRMQRLLDELLELSRVGRMGNPPEEAAFDQIVREAVDLVHGRIAARGVQVEIADNLPAVYVDRTRLVEVVQNLVDNAVKFMGGQPEPRIIIGALGSERAGMPIFFVQDNGVGIEPEYHERIFGLFNKLDAKSEGTGVGLALVKRIIDLHGGYIWVESGGVGQGSTFFFTLPRPTSTTKQD